MAVIMKVLIYLTQLQFDLSNWKDRPKPCLKKYFHDDDVINDVKGWHQSRPSIFLYKWNKKFHDNEKTSKDIIIKLTVHRYHEIMATFV